MDSGRLNKPPICKCSHKAGFLSVKRHLEVKKGQERALQPGKTVLQPPCKILGRVEGPGLPKFFSAQSDKMQISEFQKHWFSDKLYCILYCKKIVLKIALQKYEIPKTWEIIGFGTQKWILEVVLVYPP